MTRYYFDLHEPDRTTLDEHGEDFSTIEDAEQKAIETLGEIIRDFPHRDGDDLRVEVRNGTTSVIRAFTKLRIERAR